VDGASELKIGTLLAAERARRERAEAGLHQVVHSRLMTPLRWLHRLTGRGPDIAALRAADPGAPGAPLDDEALTERIIDDFHRLYYDQADRTWRNTRWFGTEVQKLPLDLWLFQEYLHTIRPDFVIECGTLYGGSAHFLGDLLELEGHGQLITIDVLERPGRPQHPRVRYIDGSSIDPAIVAEIAAITAGKTTMVILDSDHSEEHVYQELLAYAPITSIGSYLIAEDTNIHGHPVRPDHEPGPAEAVRRFLAERDDFVVEPDSHRFLLTFNPGGVLRRVR
jgi:cephalosporin hydroxylase